MKTLQAQLAYAGSSKTREALLAIPVENRADYAVSNEPYFLALMAPNRWVGAGLLLVGLGTALQIAALPM
jgi:hypothetical protein